MKISFKRTGGFANLTLKTDTIDPDTLEDKTLSEKLLTLVKKVLPSFKSHPEEPSITKPDAFSYFFEVEDETGMHRLQTSDGAMDDDLADLTELLTEVATSKK